MQSDLWVYSKDWIWVTVAKVTCYGFISCRIMNPLQDKSGRVEGFLRREVFFVVLLTLVWFALEKYVTILNSFYFLPFHFPWESECESLSCSIRGASETQQFALVLTQPLTDLSVRLLKAAVVSICSLYYPIRLPPSYSSAGSGWELLWYIQDPPHYLKQFEVPVWLHLDFAFKWVMAS